MWGGSPERPGAKRQPNMLLPQSVIPSISGPVLGTNNFGTAWGCAIGTGIE
jgi:hypothetical protein